MELIPRLSRAQGMDALSSQANIAGYKAALLAAELTARFFPMLTTAAGTIRPARVLVVGVGVAGLQAIATAKRLGAIVEAYDVRPETREQVESLGARFVDVHVTALGSGGYARELTEEEKRQEVAVLSQHVSQADAIISTAGVPGKRAPPSFQAMVEAMTRLGHHRHGRLQRRQLRTHPAGPQDRTQLRDHLWAPQCPGHAAGARQRNVRQEPGQLPAADRARRGNPAGLG
jgi:NAD/NADP transhydrogenase alpha subunit